MNVILLIAKDLEKKNVKLKLEPNAKAVHTFNQDWYSIWGQTEGDNNLFIKTDIKHKSSMELKIMCFNTHRYCKEVEFCTKGVGIVDICLSFKILEVFFKKRTGYSKVVGKYHKLPLIETYISVQSSGIGDSKSVHSLP